MLGCLRCTRTQELSPCSTWWRWASCTTRADLFYVGMSSQFLANSSQLSKTFAKVKSIVFVLERVLGELELETICCWAGEHLQADRLQPRSPRPRDCPVSYFNHHKPSQKGILLFQYHFLWSGSTQGEQQKIRVWRRGGSTWMGERGGNTNHFHQKVHKIAVLH